MQRTLAARSPARPRGPHAALPPAALRDLLASLPAGLRGGWRTLRAHRRVRIALLCGVLALPLLGGGWLWLRHSSFVAVEHVRISGVQGPEAQEIEAALRQAAHGMSTLAVSTRTLRRAVERFPMVSMVSARASFPHSLRIAVEEEPPVAVLTAAGVKTAVAADGTVLGDNLASGSLPSISGNVVPGAGQRVSSASILAALRLLGGAPPVLDRLTSKVYEGPRGLTAVMSNGLVVYFGDDTLAHAKWLSLARVLADSSSAGATYVDVELPDRPAAGFSSGEQAPSSEVGAPIKATRESTVSALAAGLAANSSDPSQSSTASASGEPSTTAPTGAGEATKTEGEAPATTTPEGAEAGH
jgi:cell division protein FtsQ